MTASNTLSLPSASASLIDGATKRTLCLTHLPFTIGRTPTASLLLADTYVSRQHAQITRAGEHFLLTDIGSRHGTFVNGRRVIQHRLTGDDVLQFGSSVGPQLRFVEEDAQASTRLDILVPPRELGGGRSDLENLRAVIQTARELNCSGSLDRVFALLLQATLTATQMERGYVFLAGSEDRLNFAIGTDVHGTALAESATVSQSVLRDAAQGTDQFLVADTLTAEDCLRPENVFTHSIRTIVCIPLRQPCRFAEDFSPLLGVLYLDRRFHLETQSEIDRDLLRWISREAAALVDDAQLASLDGQSQKTWRELRIAADIQKGLMAVRIPHLSFASIEAHSEACSAIGGDFFDLVSGPDLLFGEETLSAVLVDVSGKGISAAILASTLQGMLYAQLQAGLPLQTIAAGTNAYLCSKSLDGHATMLLLRLHQDGLLEYLNCGQVQPRVCIHHAVTRLEETNLPVGLFPDAFFHASAVQLYPGWRLLLVSNGLTEAEDPNGNLFGDNQVDRAASCDGFRSVLSALQRFRASQPPTDDCTIMQISFGDPALN